MKRRNKRILAVVLAVVMAFGLASTAFAVEPPAAEIEEVVGTVYPQTPIWFSDADFVYEEGVPMPIGNDVLTGRNTVQKIATFGHEYYLVIHPQYFHNVPNPASDNYDDPDDAIAMFTIVDLLVYSPQEDEYVTCLNGNLAAFSDEYLQFNGDGDPYFQFIVALKYVDIANESVYHFTWEETYLKLSDFDIMSLNLPVQEEPIGEIDPNDPIWFRDEYFDNEEYDVMPINHTLSGRNTVQVIVDINNGNYYLVIHPQYFEDGWPADDYDDQYDSTQILAIVDLLVYSPQEDEYVICLNGNLATFSDEYLQFNGDGDPYFQFIVALKYVDIANESVSHFTWEEAYLKCAEFDIPH